MHEDSLARALLRQVLALMDEHGADVVEVRITVGEFSGVEPELLETAFRRLAADSPISAARLTMNRVALEAECQSCNDRFLVERFRFACPVCQSSRVEIVRGEELMLDSVIMESRDE